MSVAGALMTTEELLALPDEGMDRWLIQGQVREKAMTYRNRWHSLIVMRLGQFLNNWLDSQPHPRGAVYGGEAGCRLRRNPDTTVGLDAVYISAELAARQPNDTTIIDGVPTLAVEVLSPSDKQEEINEKVDEYLAAGVPLVWVIDPHRRTILVHRPDSEPELVTVRQELTGEPHLPGLRIPAAKLFE
jgi:Uma2 family endonuclease